MARRCNPAALPGLRHGEGRRARPDGLVVTVNSPDESEPPTTERFPIKTTKKHRGAIELRTPVDPKHRYDLFASVATPDGLASESVRVELAPRPASTTDVSIWRSGIVQ